jgi:hypothetical protein
MTDRDQAQMDALREVYPLSLIFLCIWHVLRAIRSHLSTTAFQSLWEKLKILVKTDDLATFNMLWSEISSDPSVPDSVVQYMSVSWMPLVYMWSRVAWKGCSIFLEGDTNMLIEAYVHLYLDQIR